MTARTPGFPISPPWPILCGAFRGRNRCPTTSENCRPANDGLYRFLGGSPVTVAFRLILLSILVGVVLAAIGFDPWNILHSIQTAVPAAVGSRLRRRQLAVALLPARRRDRDPDLAAVAAVRHARAGDSHSQAEGSRCTLRFVGCGHERHGRRDLAMHSPAPPSKVTTAQVFAIAGPAMIANLTTPLIGIVSTTAIGRLGDATLLGGVAMASVLFDCMFWLFGFLRMSTVAFTAQSLGAGETSELRAILVRGLIVAAVIGAALIALQIPLAADPAQRDGRQRGRHARRQDLLHDPDLVCAAGARQLCRAGLADRPGPRQAGAGARRSRSTSSTWRRRCCWCWCSTVGIAGAAIAARDRGGRRPHARHC